MSLVQLYSIAKNFDENRSVLTDINFELNEHEIVSIIGPSGCGKTTLLKIIAGLVKQTSGEVILNKDEISFVFQDAALLPWLTVRKNIELPLTLAKFDENQIDLTVSELLELVNLSDVSNYYPWQLSGGMKMRVSIARSLTKSPQIMLLDEPFGSLDVMTRNKLNEDFLRLHEKQKWSAFFVTHSITEAVFLSSRIVVLAKKPATFVKVINVNLPFQRTEKLREQPEYLKLVAEVSHELRISNNDI